MKTMGSQDHGFTADHIRDTTVLYTQSARIPEVATEMTYNWLNDEYADHVAQSQPRHMAQLGEF